jgi:hypothetical protein
VARHHWERRDRNAITDEGVACSINRIPASTSRSCGWGMGSGPGIVPARDKTTIWSVDGMWESRERPAVLSQREGWEGKFS